MKDTTRFRVNMDALNGRRVLKDKWPKLSAHRTQIFFISPMAFILRQKSLFVTKKHCFLDLIRSQKAPLTKSSWIVYCMTSVRSETLAVIPIADMFIVTSK